MTMIWQNKRWKLAGNVLFGILAIGLVVRLASSWMASAGPAVVEPESFAPFTVTLHQSSTDEQGVKRTRVLETTTTLRTDGSRVLQVRMDSSRGSESMRYFDFSSGLQVKVDDMSEIKSTTYNEKLERAWIADPRSQCLNAITGKLWMPGIELAGQEDVAGYRSAKLRRGNGTWWMALDHGCAILQVQNDWGGGVATEQSVAAFLPGEPQSSLFHIPASYREVAPSDFRPANAPAATPTQIKAMEGTDEWYRSHRPPPLPIAQLTVRKRTNN